MTSPTQPTAPTRGRIVHYVSDSEEFGSRCRTALVVHLGLLPGYDPVEGDNVVSLRVFDVYDAYNMHRVVQDENDKERPMTWHWPDTSQQQSQPPAAEEPQPELTPEPAPEQPEQQ
jgi:hypothetical protein